MTSGVAPIPPNALAVRLLYLWSIRGTPLVDILLIDSETYHRLARSILGGTFRGEEVYAMNPLYPYFLAGVYAMGGGAKLLAYAVQAGLDAASCATIAWIGIRLFGVWTGADEKQFLEAVKDLEAVHPEDWK
jgi:hypothetical protein